MEAGEGGSRSADERQMINQELAVRYLADEMSGYPVRAPERAIPTPADLASSYTTRPADVCPVDLIDRP